MRVLSLCPTAEKSAGPQRTAAILIIHLSSGILFFVFERVWGGGTCPQVYGKSDEQSPLMLSEILMRRISKARMAYYCNGDP